jgi:hypothetical protein
MAQLDIHADTARCTIRAGLTSRAAACGPGLTLQMRKHAPPMRDVTLDVVPQTLCETVAVQARAGLPFG